MTEGDLVKTTGCSSEFLLIVKLLLIHLPLHISQIHLGMIDEINGVAGTGQQ